MKITYLKYLFVLLMIHCINSYGQNGPAVPLNTGIENYSKSTTITVEGILTDADIANIPAGGKHVTYQYIDGLGRPIQQVNLQASPAGYDLVQFAVYDKYGNQPKGYLPYASSSQDGRLQTNAIEAQPAFYNKAGDKIADDSKPFAVSRFEDSPSGRLLEQGAPGADWQPEAGHTMKSDFRLNTVDDHVKIWTSAGSSQEYGANKLIVSKITDENGNHGLVFSDKMGRKILKRMQLEENITEDGATALVNYLETYLVYDDYGQVIYQVPPKAVAKLKGGAAWNEEFIITWVFSYTYDIRGRLIKKNVPSGGPVYICYDKLDRPVLVQDAKSSYEDRWFFVKYDQQERPVLEGIYTYNYQDTNNNGADSRESLQLYLDGLDYSPGSILSFEERKAGTPHGYTNRTFPSSGTTILSVHYYDDYDFNYDGTADYSYTAQALPGEKVNPQASAVGYATGSKSLVMGTTNWLVGYTFYDKYGQPIQSRGNNHLSLTPDNLSTSVYAYDGTVKVTKAYHKAGPGKEVTVINKFEYDLKGRLKKVFQNNNNASSDQLVAQYEYNELGQLVDKKLHGVGANFLQSVDFRYNIRGWLTHINNSKLEVNAATNDESNDLFGMEFLYNTAQTGLNDQTGDKKYWNGNVSAVKWKVQPDANATQNTNPIRERSYKFNYDKVGRLKQATYQAYSGTAWNVEVGGYNEGMTYDHNGNILTLTRNTLANGATTPTLIDQLIYHYEGNHIKAVSDNSQHASGFNDESDALDEYTFDYAGNMTSDDNKGIGEIIYNELNKISLILYYDGRIIKYIYEAGGGRLRKEVFQAGATTPSKTIDYAGSFVYENGSLSYFGMAEGRVKANGSSLTYEYFITDHQGNTRVSFEAYNNGTATVARLTQENHYYPFGMSMTGMAVRTATPSNPNKHLYNQGSELQDDFGDSPGYYSTPFREYDPVLGRFTGVDPLADEFADWTPYTYAYNNPISFNDPTGLEGDSHKHPKNGCKCSKCFYKSDKKSGGGGGSSLYDYSGMIFEEPEPFEFNYNVETEDSKTDLERYQEAHFEHVKRNTVQVSFDMSKSGGDESGGGGNDPKPGSKGDLGLKPMVVNNLPPSQTGSTDEDPMLGLEQIIDFIFDVNISNTFNRIETSDPNTQVSRSPVPVIGPLVRILTKATKVVKVSGWVKRSVFNSLDPAIQKKVVSAIENGIVAPTGKQGIIKLTATEAAETGYQYKVKILGKGGDLRIYGNSLENGHIFFDKIMGH